MTRAATRLLLWLIRPALLAADAVIERCWPEEEGDDPPRPTTTFTNTATTNRRNA